MYALLHRTANNKWVAPCDLWAGRTHNPQGCILAPWSATRLLGSFPVFASASCGHRLYIYCGRRAASKPDPKVYEIFLAALVSLLLPLTASYELNIICADFSCTFHSTPNVMLLPNWECKLQHFNQPPPLLGNEWFSPWTRSSTQEDYKILIFLSVNQRQFSVVTQHKHCHIVYYTLRTGLFL